MRGGRALAERLVAVAALVAGHVVLVQPLRRGGAALVAPTLADDLYRVAAVASPPGVALLGAGGVQAASWSVPLGVYGLVGAAVLAAVAPRRPLWLGCWGVLVVLGLVDLACVAAGAAGLAGALDAHAFVAGYVIRPASVAVPLLLLRRLRVRATSAPVVLAGA